MHEVYVSEDAEQDIQHICHWWHENRSPQQAAEWYEEIYLVFQSLQQMPERCPVVAESQAEGRNIRQLFFTIGHRYTHRIIFLVEAPKVTILRVRHISQNQLPDDMLGDQGIN